MNPRLIVEVGKQVDQEFEIPPKTEVFLGRDPFCVIRIFDPQLSRRHCRLTFDGERAFIKDLDSKNGTKVNTDYIRKKTELRNGDHVGVGSTRLVFKYVVGRAPAQESKKRLRPKSPAERLAENVDKLEGEEFAGFSVEKKIWHGNLTTIYLARRPSDQEAVALKILRPDARPTVEELNRFQRGTREAVQLNHRNLVRVLAVDKYLGINYAAMEYFAGQNLQSLLEKAGRPMKPAGALKVMQQLLSALQYVYEQGYVLRSVKPDNVLVGKGLSVKLTDYDLLKHLPGVEEKELTRVIDGGMFVEPSFAAPELITYPVVADQRADVFGAGTCLFFMLTGAAPFPNEVPDKLSRAFDRTVPNPKTLNPKFPEELSKVILKSMSGYLDRRYQTPQEMLDDIQELQASLSGNAR